MDSIQSLEAYATQQAERNSEARILRISQRIRAAFEEETLGTELTTDTQRWLLDRAYADVGMAKSSVEGLSDVKVKAHEDEQHAALVESERQVILRSIVAAAAQVKPTPETRRTEVAQRTVKTPAPKPVQKTFKRK